MTFVLIRLQHLWAVLLRDEARAHALLEILIMLDTSACNANVRALAEAHTATKVELATTKAALADATAKLADVATNEQMSQREINAIADIAAHAVAPAAPAEQPAN